MTTLAVPYIFNTDDMAHWAHTNGGPFTYGQALDMMFRVGRDNAPRLLDQLAVLELLAADAYRATAYAWSACEYPGQALPALKWRRLFHRAGYTVDGEHAPRPAEPLQLFRGGQSPHGWSWTATREIAEEFATRQLRGRPVGNVWTALVEPGRILAHCCTDRDEDEYVIDTARVGSVRRPLTALTVDLDGAQA